jgi:NitT/TauT family transport system substrate-binding protein
MMRRLWTTRSAARAAIVIAVLGLLAGMWDGQPAAQAAGPLTELRVGNLPIADAGSLFVADAGGYAEKHGLRLKIVFMAGGATIAPAVESGSLELGMSNVVSILQAREHGFNFKCIAGALRKSASGKPELALLASPKGHIINAASLQGRQVAVNTLGNINQLIAEAYLSRNGVAPGSVRYVAIDFPEMPEALATGRVAAAIVDEPFVTLSLRNGASILEPRPYKVIAPGPLFSCYFGSARWIRTHRKEARAFVDALNNANKRIAADPGYLTSVLPKYTKIPQSMAGQIALPEFTTDITPADLKVWLDAAVRLKMIKTSFNINEVIEQP